MNKKSQNKNIGPFLAFDENWFIKHQKILVWALNAPIIKHWTRWIFRITKQDHSIQDRIYGISTNRFYKSVKIVEDKIEVTVDFRTHHKYAKRVYYAFKPIWWTLHYWDLLLADELLPKISFGLLPNLSFGFTTLTAFPDPNPETTTVDGFVNRGGVNETLATIRAGAGNGVGDVSTADLICYIAPTATSNQYSDCYRSIFLFDTSAIPDTNTISAAVLSLAGMGSVGADNLTQTVEIVLSTPASNTGLVAADYNQVGSVRQATGIAASAYNNTDGTYNNFTLNATGISNVSKTGVSKFGGAFSGDIDNSITWANNAGSYKYCYYADQAGTTTDPKLVVTYSATSIKTVDGLAQGSVKTVDGLAIASVKTMEGLA